MYLNVCFKSKYRKNMNRFVSLVIIPFLIYVPFQVQAKGHYYAKSGQIKANKSFPISYNLVNSRNDENSIKGRMFGIDTGNSDTDQEAGMWLFALLGTLAAAVPVAFLSPNLGFKKRSVNEDILWNKLIQGYKDVNQAFSKALNDGHSKIAEYLIKRSVSSELKIDLDNTKLWNGKRLYVYGNLR